MGLFTESRSLLPGLDNAVAGFVKLSPAKASVAALATLESRH
jgi:hypothetical protein